MTKITIDVPDDLLMQLDRWSNHPQELEVNLAELLRLGLSHETLPANVYSYVLNFLISNPTPQQLLEFKPTGSMQARLQELLSKSRSGEATLSERHQLDEYERIEHLIVMLKARNLRAVTANS